jgi:hypothetical protein
MMRYIIEVGIETAEPYDAEIGEERVEEFLEALRSVRWKCPRPRDQASQRRTHW